MKAQFELQARLTPEAPAVRCGVECLTYAALNEWANRVASAMRAQGIRRGDTVAVCTTRSTAMAATVLGALKAGAAYLPLDADHPRDRLRFMVSDAQARAVATHRAVSDRHTPDVWEVPVVSVDPADVAEFPAADGEDVATAADLMYVLYTSGSTGAPKGVAMHQVPQVALADWSRRNYADRPVALQFFPITSDVASYELLTTWQSGGCLVIAEDADRYDVAALASLIREHGVTRVMLPPAVLRQLAEYGCRHPEKLASLREFATTGERLVVTPELRQLLARLPGAFLENQYGSTEVNVVTTRRLQGPPDEWPERPSIGRPMGNARIYVLDGSLAPAPVNVPGEIYVGGDVLAYGYRGRSSLTAERFVPDPFRATVGARMYRMGDIGRWRADGSLEFLGRTDFQVKIRGYRVEPAEIEAVLLKHPDVAAAVVTAAATEPTQLVAYVVAAGAPPSPADLRGYLKELLPPHLVPSAWVLLDRLPRTSTGKVDRQRLPAPAQQGTELVPPRTEAEKIVAGVWAEVLGVAEVGVNDNFFDLGGHSLLIMPIIHQLGSRFGVELPLRALFDTPTIAELAESVAHAPKRTAPSLARRARTD